MTGILSIVGLFVAVAVWWVGWQNMQIARAKLQYDLFEKRFKVYDAAQTLLISVMREDEHELIPYWNAMVDADFLLNDEMALYLEGLIDKVVELEDLRRRADPRGDPMLPERLFYTTRNMGNELSELRDKFRPFLALPEIRTVPLWMERVWWNVRFRPSRQLSQP